MLLLRKNKVSFIKFDDRENLAFRDIILKRNQSTLSTPEGNNGIFEFRANHEQISNKLSSGGYEIKLGMPFAISSCAEGDYLKHEMAIEFGVLHQLSEKHAETCKVFGEWDYLSHQIVASPFKPIDYMDKMDLFGYSYIPNFKPTIARYLVGEIKKDIAKFDDVDQLLKYVDWVKGEYCFGDYSMIHAFLIAYDFDQDVIQHKQSVGLRKYTIGVKPAKSLEWKNIKLVKYSFNSASGQIGFALID